MRLKILDQLDINIYYQKTNRKWRIDVWNFAVCKMISLCEHSAVCSLRKPVKASWHIKPFTGRMANYATGGNFIYFGNRLTGPHCRVPVTSLNWLLLLLLLLFVQKIHNISHTCKDEAQTTLFKGPVHTAL